MNKAIEQTGKKVVDGVIYTGGQTVPEKKAVAKKPEVKKTETDK
jgi:hypothetical protein